jgi:type III pantothenate kinase
MRLLAIDIGNSDVTVGIWTPNQWLHMLRLPSDVAKSTTFYFDGLRDFFLEKYITFDTIECSILSSVVPDLTSTVTDAVTILVERQPILLDATIYERLPIKILNPQQIGSDLVANALAAFTLYKDACLIVDFGTALTFTTVSKQGEVLGVAIVPGLKTAIKALTQNTAKLFEVPLQVPDSALGKNTTHAIQAGVLLGYESLVSGMIERIKSELKNPELKVIATGGLSSILPALKNKFTDVDAMLTLNGLRHVAEIILA